MQHHWLALRGFGDVKMKINLVDNFFILFWPCHSRISKVIKWRLFRASPPKLFFLSKIQQRWKRHRFFFKNLFVFSPDKWMLSPIFFIKHFCNLTTPYVKNHTLFVFKLAFSLSVSHFSFSSLCLVLKKICLWYETQLEDEFWGLVVQGEPLKCCT